MRRLQPYLHPMHGVGFLEPRFNSSMLFHINLIHFGSSRYPVQQLSASGRVFAELRSAMMSAPRSYFISDRLDLGVPHSYIHDNEIRQREGRKSCTCRYLRFTSQFWWWWYERADGVAHPMQVSPTCAGQALTHRSRVVMSGNRRGCDTGR